ncbi:MAG: fatty acid desaturase [Actinobacteria bacterium]|nr:fatty acid desaturase [Actinomycetota bacterium]
MAEATATWRDRKRYLWPLALLMPLLPFVAVAGFASTGQALFLWIGPLVILGFIPLLDLVVGLDPSDPPDTAIEALESDRYYRWITFLFLPLQYAGFLVALAYLVRADLTTVDRIGLAVTVGFIAGLGINTAHELGHKREPVERWLAKIALAQSAYGHFYIEHNRGHHVRVATPKDPASSRMGENFYQFWPRTVIGSARSAWNLEAKRLARRKQSPWRLGNDILTAWLMSVVLFVGVGLWLGAAVIPYLVLQAVVGFTLLEAVNYLEHYGLLRQRVGVGDRERYERVEPRHSWNSNNIATNVLLYHLQRHSDHHANPTRRYQALRNYDEAPSLPTGYAGMILTALVPALWRRVMDPRVIAHVDGDISRANIAPRKRDRILARYAVSPTQPSQTRAEGEPPVVAQLEAGQVARCPGCGYIYDVSRGDLHEGFAPGTPWSAVPDSWICPDCGVRDKGDFVVEMGTVEA